jgi:hypothetical protein
MGDRLVSEITVDMTYEVGWARLALIQDLRTLRDAGQVRWHDGHLQLQRELLEVFRHALVDDETGSEQSAPPSPPSTLIPIDPATPVG